MRPILTALCVIFVFGAVVAPSASASHPTFLVISGKELLFSGASPAGASATLRALNAGVLGTLTCEKVLVDGFASPSSTLAHRVKFSFHGKCEQTTGGTKSACTEPIAWKTSLAELGLVLGNKTIGIFVEPSDGTKVFAEPTCGGTKTTYEGTIVGEIPETNQYHENQYGGERSEIEAGFEAAGKTGENQNVTSIELLGTNMTGVELKLAGFFGGKASQEMSVVLTGDDKIGVCR